jgi:hypothetical protein
VITGINPNGSLITRKIEDIQVGDLVLARNQYDSDDDLDLRRVTRVFRKTSDHTRILRIQDDNGNVETIRTTNEHPFYVEGKGWTAAGELTMGALLDQFDGSGAVVIGSACEAHPEGIAVYNFEVEGDHTYFVEDGDANQTTDDFGVWAHNVCVDGKFFGSYKGKPVEFKNSSPGRIVFRKRASEETTALRNVFDSTERINFVKHVATTKSGELSAAGFSRTQINDMALNGQVPDLRGQKFQVHHKKPLDGGGDNAFDNLIIMKQSPYHAALTTEQQRYVGDLQVGEERQIDFALFTGMSVYIGK